MYMTSICYKYNTFPQYMNAKNMLRSHGLIGNSANSGNSKGIHFENPTNGNLSGGKLADGNSVNGNSADGNSADENSADGNSADGNSADGNSADSNSANRKSADGNSVNENSIGGNSAIGNVVDGNSADGNSFDQNSANGNSMGGNLVNGNVADGNSAKGDSITSNELNYNDLFEDDYEKLHSNRCEMCDLNVANYEQIETKTNTSLMKKGLTLALSMSFICHLWISSMDEVSQSMNDIHRSIQGWHFHPWMGFVHPCMKLSFLTLCSVIS